MCVGSESSIRFFSIWSNILPTRLCSRKPRRNYYEDLVFQERFFSICVLDKKFYMVSNLFLYWNDDFLQVKFTIINKFISMNRSSLGSYDHLRMTENLCPTILWYPLWIEKLLKINAITRKQFQDMRQGVHWFRYERIY